jgi:hypothetical protein
MPNNAQASLENASASQHMPGIVNLPIMPKAIPAYSSWPNQVQRAHRQVLQRVRILAVAAQLEFESNI